MGACLTRGDLTRGKRVDLGPDPRACPESESTPAPALGDALQFPASTLARAGPSNTEAPDPSNTEDPGPSNTEAAGPSHTEVAGCPSNTEADEISDDWLDSLDLCANSPSDTGDDNRDPVLEPKHDIFLSHSGKQKDFTELLCRELERWGYNPFFDVREDCLPKGKRFPELIFRAARQCRVAILILSEDFFTNTKWPMLELATFVNSQKESRKKNIPEISILPVYLELSRKECTKDEERHSNWLSVWKEWQELAVNQGEKPIDIYEWENALKVLSPSNGIEYNRVLRQAGLIDQIVSTVRNQLPLPDMASDANIHAKRRICETIIKKIVETTPSKHGVRVVGMYGMGGIGKTTFCKELCYMLDTKFERKVCHAELGTVTKSELQRKVLLKLTNINPGSLLLADDSKVIEHLKTRMAGEKVFLALDNVWQESKEEAMYFLKAHYGHGSIVLVTARTIDILKSLKIKESDCLGMPELEEKDARKLFLHYASGPGFESQTQTDEDERNIQYCIQQCRFSKGENMGEHFHPLALKVLGLQVHGDEHNTRKWVESLSEDNEFDHDRIKEDPMFSILGRAYSMIPEKDQLLFLDAVLFNPEWKPSSIRSSYYGLSLYEWLSIMHCLEELLIKKRLQGLKARGLLEDIGDGVGGVVVHDLYREFAKFEVKRGNLSDRHLVWHDEEAKVFPTDLLKTPPGHCWSNVERVGVEYDRFKSLDKIGGWKELVERIKWQHFANVVVLELRIGYDQVLDLGGLQCLRSLTLEAPRGTVTGLGELRYLGWLHLEDIHCEPCLQEIGCLTELQTLRIETNCSWYMSDCKRGDSQPLELLNLSSCVNLRELRLECACLKAIPDMSQMTSLRTASFKCRSATEGPGLGSQLSALQELRLWCCESLCGLQPGLDVVVSLQVLEVWSCHGLEQFPDLCMLTRLQELTIKDCSKLRELPQLGELVALEELQLWGLPEVRALPDMHMLTKLRFLSIMDVPQLMEHPQLPLQLPKSQIPTHKPSKLMFESNAKYGVSLVAEDEWYHKRN